MKTCDKCNELKKAHISIEVDHQEFDLCQLHYQELMIFLNKKDNELEAPKRGRPRKNLENPSPVQ